MKRSSRSFSLTFYASIIFVYIAVFLHSSNAVIDEEDTVKAILLKVKDTVKSSIDEKQIEERVRIEERNKFFDILLKHRGFTDEEINKMPALSKWLLVPQGVPPPINTQKKNFTILTWKFYDLGVFRDSTLLQYAAYKTFSIFNKCSVQNCQLIFNQKDFHKADAVLFFEENLPTYMPTRKRLEQRWIFMTDITLDNVINGTKMNLSKYNGIFNWTMTYRTDSDVPIPYISAVRKNVLESFSIGIPQEDRFSKQWRIVQKNVKNNLVVVLNVSCEHNKQQSYIMELKHILEDKLGIIGNCEGIDDFVCPNYEEYCGPINTYKFHLIFETFSCKEFISEKIYYNAYMRNVVPVIWGPSPEICERFLPKYSYIHVDEFRSASELAHYLLMLDANDDLYLMYHHWRDEYIVSPGRDPFHTPSLFFCRICEALNYNSEDPKVYDDLDNFWNVTRDCHV